MSHCPQCQHDNPATPRSAWSAVCHPLALGAVAHVDLQAVSDLELRARVAQPRERLRDRERQREVRTADGQRAPPSAPWGE